MDPHSGDSGPDSIGEKLRSPSAKRKVKTVAFGTNYKSYFIIYDDGGWSYSDIPSGLSALIEKRMSRADLECVSLGPDDEYFLAAKNGRAWWGGMTTDALKQVDGYKNRLKFLDFGRDGAFVARYT